MMKKTWKYTESDQEYVCHLDFLNRMICMQTPYNNYNIPMVHWLSTTIHRMPLEIEAEVTRLILDYIDPLELNEDEYKRQRKSANDASIGRRRSWDGSSTNHTRTGPTGAPRANDRGQQRYGQYRQGTYRKFENLTKEEITAIIKEVLDEARKGK